MSNELVNPYQKFEDALGATLENGTLTFNVNTTTTKGTIYSDEALTVTQANPYTLDAAGRVTGDIRFQGKMRMVVKDQTGAVVRTIDNVVTLPTVDKTYDTVADVVASTLLIVGEFVRTKGYLVAGDSGANDYEVVAAATGTADGGSFIDGATHQLKGLFYDRVYSAARFGAEEDETDDQPEIQNLIDYCETIGATPVLDSAKTYGLASALNIGVSGQETYLESSGRKNSATLKALSAFTGGMVIISQGGVRHMNFTGFDKDTSGHVAITLGTPSVTNPLIMIDDVLNNGGFYDFIKTIYEYDRATFNRITSEVPLGHAVMDMQTGGSYAHAASPSFTKMSLRNPDATPTVGESKKYGIILKRAESVHISGILSQFDVGLLINTETREVNIDKCVVLDLRSSVSNDLWENAWAATTAYSLNDNRKPTSVNANGHFYTVTSAGTSGGAEPTWPTTDAGTVVDGTVTWTELGESVCVSVASEQQLNISHSRLEDAIVGMKMISNANAQVNNSRIVGENAAILSISGSNNELKMANCLISGDFHLSAGGGTTRFVGENNLIAADTILDVPSHEASKFASVNSAYASGKGIDFSATARTGATTQILTDYAKGAWTPTVTANANCSVPAMSTAAYVKIGHLVHCEVVGTVTVTSGTTDTTFKFTLPFNMATDGASGINGSMTISWGGVGIANIGDWTGGNATEAGFFIPSAFVGATGSQSFSGNFSYISV